MGSGGAGRGGTMGSRIARGEYSQEEIAGEIDTVLADTDYEEVVSRFTDGDTDDPLDLAEEGEDAANARYQRRKLPEVTPPYRETPERMDGHSGDSYAREVRGALIHTTIDSLGDLHTTLRSVNPGLARRALRAQNILARDDETNGKTGMAATVKEMLRQFGPKSPLRNAVGSFSKKLRTKKIK